VCVSYDVFRCVCIRVVHMCISCAWSPTRFAMQFSYALAIYLLSDVVSPIRLFDTVSYGVSDVFYIYIFPMRYHRCVSSTPTPYACLMCVFPMRFPTFVHMRVYGVSVRVFANAVSSVCSPHDFICVAHTWFPTGLAMLFLYVVSLCVFPIVSLCDVLYAFYMRVSYVFF